MGSGGSGSSGGSSGGGGGWGTTMGSGGNAYGRGGVGGIGTAGTMSGGAGGSAMGGFGNTAAGGSGMAGVSTQSGATPAGFTPAYGDPRGLALGMNADGTYGNPEAGKIGLRSDGTVVRGYVQVRNPRTNQLEYRTIIQHLTPAKNNPGYGYTASGNLVQMPGYFSSSLPTQTQGLMPPNSVLGTIGIPSMPANPFGGTPHSINPPTSGKGLPSASNTIGSSLGGMAGNPAGQGLPGGSLGSTNTRGALGGGFSGAVGSAGPRGMAGSPAGRR